MKKYHFLYSNYYKDSIENPSSMIPIDLIPTMYAYNTKNFIQVQLNWLGFGIGVTKRKKKLNKITEEIIEVNYVPGQD